MRRLVAYCVPALLLALPTPSLASNDGVIVFTPPQPQAAESASGGAPASAPAPTRGRYGGGFVRRWRSEFPAAGPTEPHRELPQRAGHHRLRQRPVRRMLPRPRPGGVAARTPHRPPPPADPAATPASRRSSSSGRRRRTRDPDDASAKASRPRRSVARTIGGSIEARCLARRLRERLDAGWPVLDRATRAVRPAHPGDVALLFRAMTDLWPYESALADEGFDYHTIGGSAFYAQQEVHDVINLLSVVEDPFDEIALAGALRSPFFGVSDEGLFRLATTLEDGGLTAGLYRLDEIDGLSSLDRRPRRAGRRAARAMAGRQGPLPMARLVARILDESGFEGGAGLRVPRRPQAGQHAEDRPAGARLRPPGRVHAGGLRRAPARRPGERAARGAGGDDRRGRREHPADVDPPGQGAGVPDRGAARPRAVLARRRARWSPAGPTSAWSSGRRRRPRSRPTARSTPRCRDPVWRAYLTLERADDEQESLRLFYVAATRARDALILSAGLGPDEPVKVHLGRDAAPRRAVRPSHRRLPRSADPDDPGPPPVVRRPLDDAPRRSAGEARGFRDRAAAPALAPAVDLGDRGDDRAGRCGRRPTEPATARRPAAIPGPRPGDRPLAPRRRGSTPWSARSCATRDGAAASRRRSSRSRPASACGRSRRAEPGADPRRGPPSRRPVGPAVLPGSARRPPAPMPPSATTWNSPSRRPMRDDPTPDARTVFHGAGDLAFRDREGRWHLIVVADARAGPAHQRLRLQLAAMAAPARGLESDRPRPG